MRASPWLGVLLAISCGGQQKPAPPQRGYAELMSSADLHQQRADRHERAVPEPRRVQASDNHACGDVVLNDQLTTGTERVTSWMPCWDSDEEAAEAHRAAAARELKTAREERAQAAALARAELASCRGIPPRELTHTPLSHSREIAEVIPHREGGEVRGVHVVFKRVLGLDAKWMERAIACHRARSAALGHVASIDPTLLPGTEVTVTQDGDHVQVYIRAADGDTGALALARAQSLIASRTATR